MIFSPQASVISLGSFPIAISNTDVYFDRNPLPWPTILGDWLVIISVRDFRRFSPLHFGYSISYIALCHTSFHFRINEIYLAIFNFLPLRPFTYRSFTSVSAIMAYRLDGVADASLLCIACCVYTDCIVICDNYRLNMRMNSVCNIACHVVDT